MRGAVNRTALGIGRNALNVLSLADFVSAVESERVDRASAIVGLPERICGLPVVQLTPWLVEFLIAKGSPFISGGNVTPGAILHFLWILNPRFDPIFNLGGEEFIELNGLTLDYGQARKEISEYMERTFLDAPTGKEELPLYSSAVGIARQLMCDPFRWSEHKALHTPLRKSYQYLKAHAKSLGANVVNGRSGKISGELLDMQNAWNAMQAKWRAQLPCLDLYGGLN